MGDYLNPGNDGFKQIINDIYVDKTGLIDYINDTIGKPRPLTCFSRPRRFGKSFAAKMLCAYYDRSCDSRSLFEGLTISKSDSFEKHLNKYDVIYLDITWFISTTPDIEHVVTELQEKVIADLKDTFGNITDVSEPSLPRMLSHIAGKTGKKFVVIIDEWDALFREAKENTRLQEEYVRLLRGLFKGGVTTDRMIAAAYMTGILPIKKYGTESALTDFREYTMVDPLNLAEYIGFTEEEVKNLCNHYNMDFDQMKQWYDGYSFSDVRSVYSPNSVINAVHFRKIKGYWPTSGTYESLKNYISMNFDGLKDAIIAMLGGEKVRVRTERFQNDMTSFRSKDDVLTLLIHLGYLAYDELSKTIFIPNLEVADIFRDAVENDTWREIAGALSRSEDLLSATIHKNSHAVESALEEIHNSDVSVLQYNDENSLSCAITLAYYTARNYYKIIRELPTGKGFADLAFLPYRNTDKPALLVELKYNKNADSAIQQIKSNRYDGSLKKYFGNLLLVGINYEKNATGENAKKHTCIIEDA